MVKPGEVNPLRFTLGIVRQSVETNILSILVQLEPSLRLDHIKSMFHTGRSIKLNSATCSLKLLICESYFYCLAYPSVQGSCSSPLRGSKHHRLGIPAHIVPSKVHPIRLAEGPYMHDSHQMLPSEIVENLAVTEYNLYARKSWLKESDLHPISRPPAAPSADLKTQSLF